MNTVPKTWIAQFLSSKSASGILLMLAAMLAVIISNTSLQTYYAMLLDTPVEVRIGAIEIAKPLLLWINDGLMAIFFFLVGLELKRELIEGELADKRNIILPAVGAIGGMAAPALIYIFFNAGDSSAMQGWAIPTATDIAFALGILFLLGSRVPISLKIFLTSLAIFDDVGAIIIIALFYTASISKASMIVIAVCIAVLVLLNKAKVSTKSIYIVVGLVMWVATLKSGVHATLAGVVLAFFIPLKTAQGGSPLKEMEHDLHGFVAFFVLPLFAFANSGINFSGVGFDNVFHSVPLGIALGLFVGKQLGVFGLCWLAIKIGLTSLPKGMSWASLYGLAALCGVGFTMSLFIGSLAFEGTGVNLLFDERIGIVLGSVASGIVGYLILRKSLNAG
ncbi:MAG: Na+/H+ antiporter NhaA [Mariprofundaceae bacterium]|nr:Na+/H+ antiporter NhaA [Mariprofundaceae bacterium]